jgi:hypothetical protein
VAKRLFCAVETSPRGDLREASLHVATAVSHGREPGANSSLRWDLHAKTMLLIMPFHKQRKGATVRVRSSLTRGVSTSEVAVLQGWPEARSGPHATN